MFGILKITAATLALAISMSACATVVQGPLTHPIDTNGEPVKVSLDEMCKRLDLSLWPLENEPDVFYCYTREGRQIRLEAGSDVYIVDQLRYKAEYPGIVRRSGQIMLSLGAYNGICEALDRKDALISNFDPLARREAWEKERPRPSADSTLNTLTIVIDAGHGGHDPGAIGIEDIHEKNVVLDVAARLRDMLAAKGAKVIMTRIDDTFVDLSERADIANRSSADIFISIHANAFSRSEACGIETLYRAEGTRGEKSKALASGVNLALVALTGATNRGAVADVRDLRVLKNTEMPAVLVEVGFTTNPEEGAKLGTEAYRAMLAKGIAEGVTQFWSTAPKATVSR